MTLKIVPQKPPATKSSRSDIGLGNDPHRAALQNGEVKALSPEHRKLIEESGITPEIAAATGYATIPATDEGRARLRELGFGKNQILTPALHIPAHDVRGDICPGQIRPDIPRIDGRRQKPIKYETPAGARGIVDVPPMAREYINDPAVDLWITEGKRKADSGLSHGLRCVISISGVDGWRGKNDHNGTTALACWESIALNGRKLYLAFDSDVTRKDEVARALARLKSFLESRGARVFVVYLPDGPKGEKTGLDDFFGRGGTVETLFTHVSDGLRPTDKKQAKAEKDRQVLASLQSTGAAIIETNDRQLDDELQDLSKAVALYNTPAPVLFHGAGGLMTIERDKDGEPFLQPVALDTMQVLAGKAARWISTSEREGVRSVAPPRDLCANFLKARTDWRSIPPIDGVKTAPFVDADGSICSTPGYHAAPRVWLSLPDGFALPDITPTPQNIAAAKSLILDTLLGEVAFADAASRAHAVALLLLPFVRGLIDDQTPLHLFDAPVQSSGKTYAAQIGVAPFCEAIPSPEKKNDEENRKSLFAQLATGASHVFLDNIKGRLSDPTLAAAITVKSMKDRLIGTGKMVTVSTRVVWLATANNAQLDRDAVSRCVLIRLDTNEENPESHEYQNDPLRFIARNRAQVIGAILTLIRAWQAQGSPHKSGKCRSRFKEWERVIGGILESNGVAGFLENIDDARDNLDPETDAWREFLSAWHREHGATYITAAEILPLALKCEELANSIGEKEGKAARFGKMLLAKRDKVFAELKISRASTKGNKGSKWHVSPISTPKPDKKGDDGDDGDDALYLTRNLENEYSFSKVNIENGLSDTPKSIVTNATIVTPSPDDGGEGEDF